MNTANRWMKLGMAIVLCWSLFSCRGSNEDVQAARENTDNRAISGSDRQFIVEAEKANIEERNLGRVALKKSQNSGVREYAQELIDDHTAALRDLVDLMRKEGMRQPDSLPQAKHEALEKLDDLSGSAFDRQFVALMVGEHQKAVASFRNEQSSATDEDVRDYAGKVLPVLQKHLRRAEELQLSLESSPRSAPTRKKGEESPSANR